MPFRDEAENLLKEKVTCRIKMSYGARDYLYNDKNGVIVKSIQTGELPTFVLYMLYILC